MVSMGPQGGPVGGAGCPAPVTCSENSEWRACPGASLTLAHVALQEDSSDARGVELRPGVSTNSVSPDSNDSC